MSLSVGLVQPNDHIVVVQMISDAFVVKVGPLHSNVARNPSIATCCRLFLLSRPNVLSGIKTSAVGWHCRHASFQGKKTCCAAQILSVDEVGSGIKAIRPKSLMDMMKVQSASCLPA